MLQGECPKCGYKCFGWGLADDEANQICPKCGVKLVITSYSALPSNFNDNAPQKKKGIDNSGQG